MPSICKIKCKYGLHNNDSYFIFSLHRGKSRSILKIRETYICYFQVNCIRRLILYHVEIAGIIFEGLSKYIWGNLENTNKEWEVENEPEVICNSTINHQLFFTF